MRADKGLRFSAAILLTACFLPLQAAAEVGAQERLDLKSVQYSARLKRDPFAIPDFDAEQVSRPTQQLNLLEAVLVGIVTGPDLRFALVEDEAGESYTLLVGDPVYKGKITKIGDESLDAVLFTTSGQQRVHLELVKEGD